MGSTGSQPEVVISCLVWVVVSPFSFTVSFIVSLLLPFFPSLKFFTVFQSLSVSPLPLVHSDVVVGDAIVEAEISLSDKGLGGGK